MSFEINKALHPSTSSTSAAAEMEEPLFPFTSSTVAATEMEEPLLPFTSSTSFAATATEMEDSLLPYTSSAATAEMRSHCFPPHLSSPSLRWRSRYSPPPPPAMRSRKCCSAYTTSPPPPSLWAPSSRTLCLFFSSFSFTYPLGYRSTTTTPKASPVLRSAASSMVYTFVSLLFAPFGYETSSPSPPATKAFYCIFILVGIGLVNVMVSNVIDYIFDVILAAAHAMASVLSYIINAETERMKIRLKVACMIVVLLFASGWAR